MIAGVLGIIGLVLALFCVGGFMEGNMAKAGKFGAGLAICLGLILITSGPSRNTGGGQNCHTEWDGRANSEVCD
jgi:hypothetical protein